jgi:uncharacterized protein YutE (UPF0331/DUF86 family)
MPEPFATTLGCAKPMTNRVLANFADGMAATQQLARQAYENGFVIEFIVLAATLIDAFLRLGLILQHQIKTQSDIVQDGLLYQSDEDPIVPERIVFQRALAEGLIDGALYETLRHLYSQRNRVIHRYIISEITTERVHHIAWNFNTVLALVDHSVWEIANRLVDVKGGTDAVSPLAMTSEECNERAATKHGVDWIRNLVARRAP